MIFLFYHPVAHVHVFGAEQVPPFWQGLVQFASEQVEPYQPVIHRQVFGPVQLPLAHVGIHATIKSNHITIVKFNNYQRFYM